MDIEAHANDAREIIRLVRDWLNANRESGAAPLPGAASINDDHDAYLAIARDMVANLRLDPHDDLPHGDYLHVGAVLCEGQGPPAPGRSPAVRSAGLAIAVRRPDGALMLMCGCVGQLASGCRGRAGSGGRVAR
jgi:hypothetical protein